MVIRAVLAIAVFVCAAARVAGADGGAKADADELVREGMELGRAGKLDQAIAAFKRAEAIYPRAVNDCNIGLAYARQNRWAQAHFFLVRCRERWSREETRPMDAWVDQRIKKSLAALKDGDYAPVDIRVTPVDAVVRVSAFAPDETFVGGRIVWLPHGSATVAASREGYQPKEIALAVSGRARQTASIDLSPIPVERPTREPDAPPPDVSKPSVTADPTTDPIGPTSPPAEPTSPPARSRGAGPWLALGAGVALGIAGGVMHVQAAGSRSDLIDLEAPGSDASQDEIDGKRDTFHQQRNVTIGLYTAGGIALGVGLYLFLRSDGEGESRRPVVGAAPTKGGGTVWLHWNL